MGLGSSGGGQNLWRSFQVWGACVWRIARDSRIQCRFQGHDDVCMVLGSLVFGVEAMLRCQSS